MKIKILLLSALSLWTPAVNADVIFKKWNFPSHTWRYVGAYRCNHLGEIKFFTNSEINQYRVYHYNEHQNYLNKTRLWVKNPDGEYVATYSIESAAKNNLFFQNAAAMQTYLTNLTS